MRPARAALAAIALPFVVSGCASLQVDRSRPQVIVPPAYRFAEPGDADSLADAPWWQVFADPNLQALVREAIANNLDLHVAITRLEEARAQAGIAKSFLYPQVDATAAHTVQQNVTSHEDDVQNGVTYGFGLSWELDIFGRLHRERDAAYSRMLASEQGRRAVLVTIVGDVTSTYFLIRQLDLQLGIARQTLAANDATVTYFQTRLDGGVSNRLEVDRIRANREATAAAIPEFERQIAVAEHALSLLLGRAPGPIPRAPDAVAGAPPSIPPGVPATLLERRPDVVQAEQLLYAANADVAAAKALFFPSISLSGFAGGISGDLASFLGPAGGVWTLTTLLLQPIYNAGRLKRGVDAARARTDAAVAEYRKAALNGYREVADALIAIAKLADIRAHEEVGVLALQDAASLARDRYESGLASYIEILNADQQLFDEQLKLAGTRGAEFRARSELYRALGGGWQP